MSTLGTYTFLPYLRRGISAAIARTEGQNPTESRATTRVTVSLRDPETNNSYSAIVEKLELYGPGEVTGFDSRVAIRTWPRPDVFDAESNLFLGVELDQADLPWRYTPARGTSATTGGEDGALLQPWFCLIALKDDEHEVVPYDATRSPPLPASVVVKPHAPLPKLGQAYAWAHLQVDGVRSIANTEALAQLLAKDPRRVVARLLCPRKLETKTAYTAFLVPTYKRGVQAGLGQEVKATVDEKAWPNDQFDDLKKTYRPSAIELPVYHHWRFGTGLGGDFEYLVSQLKERELPSTVGVRLMDVTEPGSGLDGLLATPLGLEGALKAPSTDSPWVEKERDAWVPEIRRLLNGPGQRLATPGDVPRVVLPMYGRWHAAQKTVLDPYAQSASPSWFHELNVDPRLRVAAALGTYVVQSQQQQLMASAWRQVGEIRRINEELRQAQLAREAAARIYARTLAPAGTEAVLFLTAPVHARVLTQTGTVEARLRKSPIAQGVLDPQWRRVARPLGPTGRRQERAGLTRTSDVLDHMNRGLLVPVGQIGPLGVGEVNLFEGAGLRPSISNPGDIGSATVSEAFQAQQYPPFPTGNYRRPETPPPPPQDPVEPIEGVHPFRDTLTELISELQPPPERAHPSAEDLEQLKTKLVGELDPHSTIPSSYTSRLSFTPEQQKQWQRDDPLEPVMAAPTFPQPMFEPLRQLSQDWVLPGLDQVPPNTISLVATNQRFLEAYMAGLNHEMARELLWNEYPTDQRGTYFTQFWDPSGYIAPNGQAQTLVDIPPITAWQAALGTNSTATSFSEGKLVLLVRGELLRRYPHALLYATKARWTGTGTGAKREIAVNSSGGIDPQNERHPVFTGTLQPDVTFFKFELTETQALGGPSPGAGDPDPGARDAGYFFVLQEQSSETRFGLNAWDQTTPPPPTAWDQLSWAHLPSDTTYVDLTKPPFDGSISINNMGWGSNGSDMAFNTLQQAVRVAIHATDMLPARKEAPHE